MCIYVGVSDLDRSDKNGGSWAAGKKQLHAYSRFCTQREGCFDKEQTREETEESRGWEIERAMPVSECVCVCLYTEQENRGSDRKRMTRLSLCRCLATSPVPPPADTDVVCGGSRVP